MTIGAPVTLSVRIDDEMKARLRRLLAQKDRSLSDFADASLVALCERRGLTSVATLARISGSIVRRSASA
jgi:predicted transcriptional regulator